MSRKLPEIQDESEPFFQTRNVRVVWIEPRREWNGFFSAFRALDAVSGTVVLGVLAYASGVFGNTPTTAAAPVTTELHVETAPPVVVVEVPPPPPVVVPPISVIPGEPRRATLSREIVRCKNPAAACTVAQVLTLGRELMNERRVHMVSRGGH